MFLLLAGSLLVLIHGFTRSLAITTLGVIWMVVWIPVFVIAIIS